MSDSSGKQFKYLPFKMSSCLVVAGVLFLLVIDNVLCDYENTWNFYYEQPCCGSPSGQHHLRHHRGKNINRPIYVQYQICYVNDINFFVLRLFVYLSWNLYKLWFYGSLRWGSLYILNVLDWSHVAVLASIWPPPYRAISEYANDADCGIC